MNTQLRNRYNSIAKDWNGEAYAGLRQDEWIPNIIDCADLDKTPDSSRILDAMCGTGSMGTAAKKQIEHLGKHCETFFLDFSQNMLDQISVHGKRVCADATDMPFLDDFFDRTFLRFGLYDLNRNSQILALKEIRRTMKDDGIFTLITYVTTEETQPFYNMLVNFKDMLARNKNGDRYFAEKYECMQMLTDAGFKIISRRLDFSGTLRYMQTSELDTSGSIAWKKFALSLPRNIKEKMNVTEKEDGTVEYDFPIAVFTATKITR